MSNHGLQCVWECHWHARSVVDWEVAKHGVRFLTMNPDYIFPKPFFFVGDLYHISRHLLSIKFLIPTMTVQPKQGNHVKKSPYKKSNLTRREQADSINYMLKNNISIFFVYKSNTLDVSPSSSTTIAVQSTIWERNSYYPGVKETSNTAQ